NVSDLKEELKQYFPITDPKQLTNLSYFRNKLSDHYSFSRIPPNYFELPPKKELLPTTYYQLNSHVRSLFPFDPENNKMSIQQVADLLHEHYKFRTIPNDYFKQKPVLSKQPKDIITTFTYSYPIIDNNQAKKFLEEVKRKYRVTFPISPKIMTANPTDKPRLPEDHTQITQFNITVPITSPRQLVDTARHLRQEYYFSKIP
ncbi:493_t:CDS:1, partial [Paraglomus occultum]